MQNQFGEGGQIGADESKTKDKLMNLFGKACAVFLLIRVVHWSNVVFQEFEYYDFGYGTLRYARYAVSIPAKWDTVFVRIDEKLTGGTKIFRRK